MTNEISRHAFGVFVLGEVRCACGSKLDALPRLELGHKLLAGRSGELANNDFFL